MSEKKKFYYRDKDNDFIEYIEGKKGIVASWVNPHLTLLFPHDCTELIPENITGFQVHGVQYMIKKAKELADIPLTPQQEKELNEALKDAGWKPVNELEKEKKK